MAIDYIIEYDCIPKRELSVAGIVDRLKEKERAEAVMKWFREAGDGRSPDQMGFEFSHRTPDGEEKQVLVVQALLDRAAMLDHMAHHCQGCPANRKRQPFGCIGFIHYPLSASAEIWLLERLPVPDEPLIWLLLRQGIRAFGYDGTSIKALRDRDNISAGQRAYFELPIAPDRRLGELRVSSDQMLEMIFGVGERIMPNHAGVLLLFFHAIDRQLEAPGIHRISSFDEDARRDTPFAMEVDPNDDATVHEFLGFFHALYLAWKLRVPLLIDV